MSELVAATDGACTGNPGPAGWGWVIDRDNWQAGSLGRATNNIAELEAIRRVLLAVPADVPLRILTDSQYARNAIRWTAGWARSGWLTRSGSPVKNRGLLTQIADQTTARPAPLHIDWVKGHAGHPLNELADQVATSMAAAEPRRRMIAGPGWNAPPIG